MEHILQHLVKITEAEAAEIKSSSKITEENLGLFKDVLREIDNSLELECLNDFNCFWCGHDQNEDEGTFIIEIKDQKYKL
jgi:hypothetical protein